MAFRSIVDDDLSTFSSRLMYQMRRKGVDSTPKLAVALYKAQLVEVKPRGTGYDGDDGTEQTKNAIGSIKKKIAKHLQPDATIKDVQGEFINAYCMFFDCSADWLLGYTNIQNANMEVRQICEKTGLSENSIDTIRRIIGSDRDCIEFGYRSDHFLRIINTLFSSTRFIELVYSISGLDDNYASCHCVWEQLEEKLGEKLFEEAMDYYNRPTDNRNYPDAEELRLELHEAISMIDKAISRQDDLSYSIKVDRYELRELFEALVDEMYSKRITPLCYKGKCHR